MSLATFYLEQQPSGVALVPKVPILADHCKGKESLT